MQSTLMTTPTTLFPNEKDVLFVTPFNQYDSVENETPPPDSGVGSHLIVTTKSLRGMMKSAFGEGVYSPSKLPTQRNYNLETHGIIT